MSVRVYKPTYVIPELGELGRTPDGGITNIGGTINPTFSVDGRGLLFDDGTSTSGNPASNLTLQRIYNSSLTPVIVNMVPGKDIVFNAGSGTFSINAATGDVNITANLVVAGLISGVDLVTLAGLVASHLSPGPNRHAAAEISADGTSFVNISGTNVQATLESIDAQLQTITSGAVFGFQHVQTLPAAIWTVTHNQNSERIQVTVWDDTNQVVYPDTIVINNLNSIQIFFNTPATGRAVLMIY
jgi:hypothetical protein